jgi:hypothetical protein
MMDDVINVINVNVISVISVINVISVISKRDKRDKGILPNQAPEPPNSKKQSQKNETITLITRKMPV